MRKRPVLLILCSLVFLYFPGELIWRAAHGDILVFGDVLFSIIFPLLLSIGLVRVARFGWYSLIAFGMIWGFRDVYFYYSSQGDSLTPILIHLAIYLFSVSYFVNPRIRHLYFDPQLRWWRTKPRFETHGPVITKVGEAYDYPLMRNISEGGCFVETPHLQPLNSTLRIQIPLPIPLNVSTIQSECEVRWISGGALRSGMGLQ
jgi:hypothetical protein